MLNVKVHDNIIKKKKKDWIGIDCLEGLPGKSFILCLNSRLPKRKYFRQIKPKWRLLVITHTSYCGKQQSKKKNTFMPTVKHGEWEVMIWICFAAMTSWHLLLIELSMNLQSNVGPSVWQIKLTQNWVMQLNNDHQHTKKTYNQMP